MYFPYPFREFDDIRIALPEADSRALSPAHNSQSDFSSYSLATAVEGPQKLHIQRDLIIKKSYFAVDQYASIKAFYDAARAADGEQIVSPGQNSRLTSRPHSAHHSRSGITNGENPI